MVVNVLLQYDTKTFELIFTDVQGIKIIATCAPLDLEKHQCDCDIHNCGMDIPDTIIGELEEVEDCLMGWSDDPELEILGKPVIIAVDMSVDGGEGVSHKVTRLPLPNEKVEVQSMVDDISPEETSG